MGAVGIYAYVDGSDLESVFSLIERAGHEFLVSRAWSVPARLISTHYARTPDLNQDDLSQWNLGFNLDFPHGSISAGAFEDVRAIARFVADLYPRSQREFVFGIVDEAKVDEDFAFIGSDPTRVEEFVDVLRHFSGRVPAA